MLSQSFFFFNNVNVNVINTKALKGRVMDCFFVNLMLIHCQNDQERYNKNHRVKVSAEYSVCSLRKQQNTFVFLSRMLNPCTFSEVIAGTNQPHLWPQHLQMDTTEMWISSQPLRNLRNDSCIYHLSSIVSYSTVLGWKMIQTILLRWESILKIALSTAKVLLTRSKFLWTLISGVVFTNLWPDL